MAETTPAVTAVNTSNIMISTSSLLMAMVEEASDLLLHGSEKALSDPALWYLDNRATNHMKSCRNFFSDLDESTTGFVKFGDYSRIQIKGKGAIEINQNNGSTLQLCSILFVPQLEANILCLGRLDEEGYRMIMGEGKLTIFSHNGHLFSEVQRSEGRLYLLKLSIVDQCMLTEEHSEDWLWHSRFEHISFHTLKEMSNQQLVEGLPLIKVPNKLCRDCVAGKHHRTPFPLTSSYRATEPLELIYADICGPTSPPTLGGSKYFLVIDDYTRLTWVAMLQHKYDAFEAFKRFKTVAKLEKGVKLKTLGSDRGGEFTSTDFSS